ncbi:hypothetical protein ACQKFX_01160 [Cupriavidus metallidurans]|uniref:hypothetical protein n=1 Tax=Cupriavidus metallidurans TaxID=119219 RepID=UPI003CFF8B70
MAMQTFSWLSQPSDTVPMNSVVPPAQIGFRFRSNALIGTRGIDARIRWRHAVSQSTLIRLLQVAGFALFFAVSLAYAQDTVRVRGTIEQADGQTLVVESREGAKLKILLADNASVVAVVKASMPDIKQGSFIGVAGMPQADGSQRAIEVLIFPEAMRGTGEGHYPWDLRPQSTMTNATVVHIEQTVTEVDGRVLSVKYKDGERKIIVPANVPIVTFVPSDKSELKPGIHIFISAARKLPDGTLQASRINFGKDGLTPPM